MPIADLSILQKLIGQDATARLVEELGGQEVGGPKGEGGESFARLSEVVGQANALALCGVFGGDRLNVPLCRAVQKAERNTRIRTDYDAGLGWYALVKKYDLCERQIRTILGRGEDPGAGQGSLF